MRDLLKKIRITAFRVIFFLAFFEVKAGVSDFEENNNHKRSPQKILKKENGYIRHRRQSFCFLLKTQYLPATWHIDEDIIAIPGEDGNRRPMIKWSCLLGKGPHPDWIPKKTFFKHAPESSTSP